MQQQRGVCIVLLLTFLTQVEGQCRRDIRAAAAVNRRCQTQCTRGDSSCRGARVCMCDHECGYSCINPLLSCPVPQTIPNVARFTVLRSSSNRSLIPARPLPYRYNDIAEYVCLPGYSRERPVQHHCHGGGGWTGSTSCLLTCRAYNREKVLTNNMVCGRRCRLHRDCASNMRCLCDGYCGRTCVDPNLDCGSAPVAAHATIQYTGSGLSRTANYKCDDDYFIRSGDPSRRCTGGGTWDGELITCQRITCGRPWVSIALTGGHVVNWERGPYYVGRQLSFGCSSSYRLLGARERTCMSDGQWSGPLSICDRKDNTIRCPHPGVPVNGYLALRRRFSIGSFVEFGCNRGYVMVGQRRQECLYFLQWNGGGAPSCVDPRLHFNHLDGFRRLDADPSILSGVLQLRGSPGARTSQSTEPLFEYLFVVDASDETTDAAFRKAIEFMRVEIDKIPVSAKCGLILFSSRPEVKLNLNNYPKELVLRIINDVSTNRENLIHNLGMERNTTAGLLSLEEMLVESYERKQEILRRVFLLIHGMHTAGPDPVPVLNSILSKVSDSLPEVYVVTYGQGSNTKEGHEELQSLAYPPKLFLNNIQQSNIRRLLQSLRENRTCGQVGDLGTLKEGVDVGRVLGGSNAISGAWKWHALISLRRQTVVETYETLLGGGSLLNERWVLTAAHLFNRYDKTVQGWERNIFITFGLIRRPKEADETLPNTTQIFEAQKIIIHDNYNPSILAFDIALIRIGQSYIQQRRGWAPIDTNGTVTFNDYVKPVCLPCVQNSCVGKYLRKAGKLTGNETDEERCRIEGNWLLQRDDAPEKNFLAAVTGFGLTGSLRATNRRVRVGSRYLLQGRIRLQADIRCHEAVAAIRQREVDFRNTYREENLCAIGGNLQNVIDACKGDSGGPFVREVMDENTRESCWVQIGIVSWGWGCGQTYLHRSGPRNFPGFYTNVISTISWIKSYIIGGCPTRDISLLEEGRRCRKPCIADENCRGAKKKCRCDNVCGLSCFNPEANCDDLEAFANGNIIGNRTYGSVIMYWCNAGYELVGTPTRACRSDRKWSGTSPSCRKQRCTETLDVPGNGRKVPEFSSRFQYEDVVTFVCNVGYVLVGEETSSCQANGTWSNPPPVCRRRCSRPAFLEEIPNSSIENLIGPSFNPDHSITVGCNPRYHLTSGVTEWRCSDGGTWLPAGSIIRRATDDPVCRQEVRCNVPASLPFRSISSDESSVRFDRIVTYTCEDGYHIEGENSPKVTVTCRVSARNREVGQWSRENPRCVEIRCRLPTRPPEVLLSPPTSRTFFRRREQVSYECRRGLIMADQPTGMLTVTCRSNGTWTDNLPVCYNDAYKCTKSGQLCHFPFTYNGRSHSSCTTTGLFETELWCALDARFRSDRWGYCATCPSRWSLWGEWGDCSATCGSGISTRRRTCTRDEAGSPFCVGNSIQTRSCSTESCLNVEISILSSWSSWSECTRNCPGDGGQQTRSRSCDGLPSDSVYCRKSQTTRRDCETSAPCTYEEIELRGRIYSFVVEARNYTSARRNCQNTGGDLATIKTAALQTRLLEKMAMINTPALPDFPYSITFYLGMTGPDKYNWRWIDGTAVPLRNSGSYQSWGNAQPSDSFRGTEDCAVIYKGSGEWHDITCDLRLYSICERELDPCRSGPCLNGGTCHRNGRSYLCECPNLVRGTRCQDVENLCWSSPCMNEGSCSGDAESYTCQCRERWTGSNCDVGLSLCNFNETALSPGVFVVGSSGSRSYSEGETITVGCSKPGAVLRARTNMTKCSRRIWRPDYRRFTCINGI